MSWLLAICAAEYLCDAPLSGCLVVFGGWFRCPCGRSGCGPVRFRGVFDTPVFACVSNGFGGVRVGRGCVRVGVGVSFSLAARHGCFPLGLVLPVRCGGGLRTQERVCTTLCKSMIASPPSASRWGVAEGP